MTASTYSFNTTPPAPPYAPRSSNNGGDGNTPRPSSASQHEIYAELVTKRNIRMPVDIKKCTYDEAFSAIGQARSFYGASTKQLETIKNLITQLQNGGVEMGFLNPTSEALLTGGTDGTAGRLIQQLMSMTRDIDTNEKPSIKVVQYIVSMFTFPDVDWDAFEVPVKVALEPLFDKEGKPMSNVPLWRHVTPDELGTYIEAHKTAKQCSEFINTYRVPFNVYRSTLIRHEQERRIRQLEERLANIGKPKVNEWAIDLEGNLIQTTRTSEKDYNPVGYISPYSSIQIKMLTAEQASVHIEQLEKELATKLTSALDSNDATFESLRTARNRYEGSIMELKNLDNFLYALEAHTGCQSEEIHVVPYHDDHDRSTAEHETDVFFDKNSIESRRKHKKIRQYIAYVLDAEYVTLHRLMLMAERSMVATEMVADIADKELNIKIKPRKAKK